MVSSRDCFISITFCAPKRFSQSTVHHFRTTQFFVMADRSRPYRTLDRCAFVYEQFLSLPPSVRAVVDPFGGIWPFVQHCDRVDASDADVVSKFLGEVLESSESMPEAKSVAASMLSYLVAVSAWAQINRDSLWEVMRDNFLAMPSYAPGRGRLCLAMCYFGRDDVEHGRKMRALLSDVPDASEKVKLTLYICGKIDTEMAVVICGF